MSKLRYIPYGYTVRNGRTIIDRKEAETIREIFENYIAGATLQNIADDLTLRGVPYTEKMTAWDKARVARIIGNARYLGTGEYETIIDEEVFENAAMTKASRGRMALIDECEGIRHIRNRIHCGRCGYPMIRRTCNKRVIRESWICTNEQCGMHVRISDADLLLKIALLMNRIIENTRLLEPRSQGACQDTPAIKNIKEDIDRELERQNPSDDYILERVGALASELYKQSQSKPMIMAQILRKRASVMKPTETFDIDNFEALIECVGIGENGKVTLYTKTKTEIVEEGENCDGCDKNTQTNGDRH